MALAGNASNALSRLASMSIYRQLGFMLGLAASVAIAVAVVLWSREPNYIPVFSQSNARDSAEMTEVLQRNGIRYKIDQNQGLVLVPADSVQQVRLKLAQEGVPHEIHSNSYEFLTNSNAFSNSQFMENARFKLALEQELARTISQFSDIKSARVHLAIPRESAFVRDQREPSASVFLDVYASHELRKRTIASITNLVASSIPNMKNSHVTVVDQNGQMLNDGSGNNMYTQTEKMLDYRQIIEQQYAQKIQDILIPMIGYGRVQAKVAADMDFTNHEQTQELYSPQKGAVRSEQVMEENQKSSDDASGVPGALSNNVPAAAQAVPKAQGGAVTNVEAEETTSSSRRQSTKNYELDKTISHTQNHPGTIRRLSVAVLVDNKQVFNETSKTMESQPLKPEEIEQIKLLVSDAIGINPKRGDSINVLNSHFVKPEPIAPLPELMFWQKEGFASIVKQLIAAIFVLLLVFGLLRPLLRSLSKEHSDMANDQKSLPNTEDDPASLLKNAGNYEGQIALLRQIVGKEPKRVAQVVKTWVEKG